MSTWSETQTLDDTDLDERDAAADAQEDYELDRWEEARELNRIEREQS